MRAGSFLGCEPGDVVIKDMAVRPRSRNVYLSVHAATEAASHHASPRPYILRSRGCGERAEAPWGISESRASTSKPVILASWRRSQQFNVAADRIELPYAGAPDLDTPLARAALPVLRNLREALEGQPVSVILADAAGVALSRLTADHDLERYLDRLQLVPGFSYAEEHAGTNGIGTALESGQPACVFGHEHYAEDLEGLACAAAPIRDPISGRTVGAVDLTCRRRDADRLLIALAKTTAHQIAQALLTAGSAGEFELLQEYLRACRHGGIVLAVGSDTVMMNEHARQDLDPGDHAALLGQVAEALASYQPGTVTVELPTGARARLYCRPVRGDGRPGVVVHVKLIESPGEETVGTPARASTFLPGLAGSGPLWLRGCQQVDAAYAAGEWLALDGEPGTGKLAVLRAVHQRHNPAGHFRVLDAATALDQNWQAGVGGDLLSGTGCLVIRHVDQLSARQLRELSAALREAQAAGRQAAVAAGRGHLQAPRRHRRPGRAAPVLSQHRRASTAPPSR
jgi:transcriptional regulator of acetoin/glycerol metabolism